MKVSVDVAGFNYHVTTLDDVIESYKLTPEQVEELKEHYVLHLHNNVVQIDLLEEW